MSSASLTQPVPSIDGLLPGSVRTANTAVAGAAMVVLARNVSIVMA